MEDAGGKADFGTLRMRYMSEASRFLSQYNIDIMPYFDEARSRLLQQPKTGKFTVPKVRKPELPASLVQELTAALPKKAQAVPEEVIRDASSYQEMRRRMTLPSAFLERWGDTPEELLSELATTLDPAFAKKDKSPAKFEFSIAKAFSVIFQVPLEIQPGADMTSGVGKAVWRGNAEFDQAHRRYEAVAHAPGGGSDIFVGLRGFDLLVEATLRYTERQWRDEIEPIFRHYEEFVKEHDLDPDGAYLAFVTPQHLLPDTFKWIHAMASRFNVVALDVRIIQFFVEVSNYLPGLPHATIGSLMAKLRENVRGDIDGATYMGHLESARSSWARDVLGTELLNFLAVRSYEFLLRSRSALKAGDLLGLLASDARVVRYLQLAGQVKEVKQVKEILQDKRFDLLRQIELLGLGRQIDGYVEHLEWTEFEERILKMYGYAEGIRKKFLAESENVQTTDG